MRIGHGYDVHRLAQGRKLILGGVEIAYEKGLLGHSDADVLAHAISDALLGAAALGDIGHLFPDNDDRFLGADSMILLAEVCRVVREAGYEIGNIDSTKMDFSYTVSAHRGNAYQYRKSLRHRRFACERQGHHRGKTGIHRKRRRNGGARSGIACVTFGVNENFITQQAGRGILCY